MRTSDVSYNAVEFMEQDQLLRYYWSLAARKWRVRTDRKSHHNSLLY